MPTPTPRKTPRAHGVFFYSLCVLVVLVLYLWYENTVSLVFAINGAGVYYC